MNPSHLIPPTAPVKPPPDPALASRLQGVNLYLIGMMGAGKSTTGRALAETLGYGFVDSDAVIEQVAGQAITEIFAQAGEAQFRQLESQVLAELSQYHHLVVATGGGMVLEPMNWSYLRHGLVIWLNVPIPELVKRLAADTSRPLLADGELTDKLTTLSGQRFALYQQADLEILVTPELSSAQVSQEILARLPKILRDAS